MYIIVIEDTIITMHLATIIVTMVTIVMDRVVIIIIAINIQITTIEEIVISIEMTEMTIIEVITMAEVIIETMIAIEIIITTAIIVVAIEIIHLLAIQPIIIEDVIQRVNAAQVTVTLARLALEVLQLENQLKEVVGVMSDRIVPPEEVANKVLIIPVRLEILMGKVVAIVATDSSQSILN